MQLGIHFDQTRCTGCQTCTIACKDWHDIQDLSVNWLRVDTIEQGTYPDVFVAFVTTSCRHCAKPACAAACPVDAIAKRPADGVIAVDSDACIGERDCGLCVEACPYGIPQFGSEQNAKMQMCNFCPDRLAEGRLPICVDACPVYALDFGPLDVLRAKHGDNRNAIGFRYSEQVEPSSNFKPKVRK